MTRCSIYIQDCGSPVGFRLATRHPDRIQAIISQNGNACDAGLAPFWAEYLYPYWKHLNPGTETKARQLLTLASTKFQYANRVRDERNISPDSRTRSARQRFNNSWRSSTTTARTHPCTRPGTSTCRTTRVRSLQYVARTRPPGRGSGARHPHVLQTLQCGDDTSHRQASVREARSHCRWLPKDTGHDRIPASNRDPGCSAKCHIYTVLLRARSLKQEMYKAPPPWHYLPRSSKALTGAGRREEGSRGRYYCWHFEVSAPVYSSQSGVV